MRISGSIYSYALAVMAVAYVVLLVVLLNAGPGTDPAEAAQRAEAARQLVSAQAVALAGEAGLRQSGQVRVSCTPFGEDVRCLVDGFSRTTGNVGCPPRLLVWVSGHKIRGKPLIVC